MKISRSLKTAALVAAVSACSIAPVIPSSGDLPDGMTDKASAGLIQIATTGNPKGLHAELGGKVTNSSVVADTVTTAVLNNLLDHASDEHLAPKALVAPDGTIYAMVAPTITKDHFILVSTNGVIRRMDVGQTEGTQVPFVVATVNPNLLPSTVIGKASAGLLQLATTGNPNGLHRELRGEILDSTIVAEVAGQSVLNALLDIAQDEHLAPKALRAPSGEIYAMVAPTITKDNFILVTKDGSAQRMDVGATEGTQEPFLVTQIMSDGGTPWYVEFWYWVTGQ